MAADEFFSEIKDEEKGLTAKRHEEMLFNDVSILCDIDYTSAYNCQISLLFKMDAFAWMLIISK